MLGSISSGNKVLVWVAAFGLLAASVSAATIDWSSTAGTNVWATGTNWVGDVAPANNSTADIANFDSASYANLPTVTAVRSVGGITLGSNTADVTINVTGGAFTVGASGNTSTGINLYAAKTLTFTGNQAINLNGPIVETGGAANLTLSSTSTITIASANSYSGSTTLTAGTINILNSSAFGTSKLLINGAIKFRSDVTTNPTYTLANDMAWNSNFTIGAGYYAYVETQPWTLNLTGNIDTLTAARQVNISNAGNTTITGTIDNGGFLFTANVTGGNFTTGTLATLSGSITGAGGFTKSGAGILVLSGDNGYAGVTTVSDGILRLNHANALPGGVGDSGGLNNLTIAGGVVELTPDSRDFQRPLGTGAGQVQLTGIAGGFSAFGGNRTVNLGGGGAMVTWGSGGFLPYNGTLVLSSAFSDSTIDFQNPIRLNNGNQNRVIRVDNGSADVDAIVSGVISGPNAADALYVGVNSYTSTLAGLGTLRLDAANTYLGGTMVAAGRLIGGAAGSVPGPVFVAPQSTGTNRTPVATLEAAEAGAINGNVYVQPRGILVGANVSLAQVMLLPGGALQYNSAADIPGSGPVLGASMAGTVLAAGYAIDSGFLDRIKNSFAGTIALAANSANDLDLSTFPSARLGATGADAVYSGTLTPYGSTYKLGGGNTNLTISTALTDGTAARDLDVGGNSMLYYGIRASGLSIPAVAFPTGRVTLTAANPLTGNVSVDRYSTLTLTGANGSLANAASLVLNGGVLFSTDAVGASNSNRLPDYAALDVNRTGVINYTGLRGTTEDVGTLNLNSGFMYLKSTGVGSSGNAVLRFGQTTSSDGLVRSTGTSAIFNSGGNGWISFNNYTAPGPNSTMGGWAVYGYNSWAIYSGGRVQTLATYATWPGAADTDNVDITAAPSALAADKTINSLRHNMGAATLNLANHKLTITNGGILQGPNAGNGQTLTIGSAADNGQLTAGSGAGGNYELFLTARGGFNITVNSTIVDNDVHKVAVVLTNGITYDSYCNFTFNGTNTYSNGTYLNGAYLYAGNDSALGSGPVVMSGYIPVLGDNSNSDTLLSTLYPTGTGNYTRTLANAINVNADAILSAGATNTTFNLNGPITLANTSTLNLRSPGGALNLNGKITGAGNLQAAGSATLAGSTGNDYTGLTVVLGGNLTLNKSVGNAIPGDVNIGGVNMANDTSLGFGTKRLILAASDQIADAGVVTLIGGITSNNYGVLQMNGNSDTIGGLVGLDGAGIVENNHATAASTLTVNVGAGQSYNFGGLIRNRATAGGGTLSLVKSGAGSQTLTGTNTYTGTTIINGGLLVAGSNSALGTGGVTVDSGGQLATAPGVTLGNAITVNNGGYFGPQYLVNATGNYSGVPAVTSAVGGLGSTLTLLDGSASVDTILSALWRARATNEMYPTQTYPPLPGGSKGLISDVVDFTGTGSDIYALQISYDPAQIVPGMTESELVTAGLLYLAYNNGGTYANAGTTFVREGAYIPGTDFTLGNWGVDTTNHVAWAVVSHNSEWAVVPEPGTMALLAFGSLAVLNLRRKAKKSA